MVVAIRLFVFGFFYCLLGFFFCLLFLVGWEQGFFCLFSVVVLCYCLF